MTVCPNVENVLCISGNMIVKVIGGHIKQCGCGCTDWHYKDVQFNVISLMKGWGGQISRKVHYVTLEWPNVQLWVGLL